LNYTRTRKLETLKISIRKSKKQGMHYGNLISGFKY